MVTVCTHGRPEQVAEAVQCAREARSGSPHAARTDLHRARRARQRAAREACSGRLREALRRVETLEKEIAELRSASGGDQELSERLMLVAPVLAAGIGSGQASQVAIAKRNLASHNFTVPANEIASMSMPMLNKAQRAGRAVAARAGGQFSGSAKVARERETSDKKSLVKSPRAELLEEAPRGSTEEANGSPQQVSDGEVFDDPYVVGEWHHFGCEEGLCQLCKVLCDDFQDKKQSLCLEIDSVLSDSSIDADYSQSARKAMAARKKRPRRRRVPAAWQWWYEGPISSSLASTCVKPWKLRIILQRRWRGHSFVSALMRRSRVLHPRSSCARVRRTCTLPVVPTGVETSSNACNGLIPQQQHAGLDNGLTVLVHRAQLISWCKDMFSWSITSCKDHPVGTFLVCFNAVLLCAVVMKHLGMFEVSFSLAVWLCLPLAIACSCV